MKKTIICNWGGEKQGKSSSIVETLNLLVKQFPKAKVNYFPVSVEIKVIVEINGIKIGFEPNCDPDSRLIDEQLRDFVPECHIILCASRTRGATVKVVQRIANINGYRLFWVTNSRDEGQSQQEIQDLNSLSAKHFLDLIIEIMNNRL